MPRELSGGQKQRVAIARALAQGASVLLFDEPTSALDPELREEVREVLRQVARGAHEAVGAGLTIVLATHEHALAHELADEIWTLSAGKLSRS
jgi:polar amino acid transport system ATP-binding protein